jgi:hypothetical protein
VAEVLPAEALDLVSLTARHVWEIFPDAQEAIEVHEHGCPAAAERNGVVGGKA